MKAVVDKEACIGCQRCTETCPGVFKMDTDDKSVAYVDEVPRDLEKSARKAAEECPVQAIEIS